MRGRRGDTDTTTVPTEDAPARRRRQTIRTILLLLLHGAVAAILVMLAISIAVAIGGPSIGRDELCRVGPALRLAVAGAIVPFPISAVATLVAVASARRRSWAAPVVGIGASVVLWGVALLFLHAPEPLQGG